tara:strand:+ start:462 stop:686 length:225 start_codon:yes stop_codon:yes gene_type:complete
MHNKVTQRILNPVRIEIISGPFAGLIGKIGELDSQNRVKWLFNILEGEVKKSIDAKNVALVTFNKSTYQTRDNK